MTKTLHIASFIFLFLTTISCSKSATDPIPSLPPPPLAFSSRSVNLDGISNAAAYNNTSTTPSIRITFSAPVNLADAYANYWTQNRNHTLINYNYCKANPKGFLGYSDSVWGLTASDISNGYTASSPSNDVGVIAPTAALSSFPYTPMESIQALNFFYYKLGDKIWKEYGFVDAFSLDEPWFANSFLAIDQGPIIIMIENQRSGLLWNLFMSSPEIKSALRNLGFQSPHI